MKARIVCIVQARMGSVRLPGKSMMPLAGKPLVERVIRRIKDVPILDDVVLVTSELPENDVLFELALSLGVPVIRGDEENLASRYVSAIEELDIDVVVRIPADNYLTESWAVNLIVEEHLKYRSGFSTNIMQIFDSGFPDGLGAEVFEATDFLKLHSKSCPKDVDEHVHKHFFDYNSGLATMIAQDQIRTIKCPDRFAWPQLRFDVNTLEDYQFAAMIYEDLGGDKGKFGLIEVLDWHKRNKPIGN